MGERIVARPEDGTVYYVGDPMCSWCYGYHPVLQRVKAALGERPPVVYVMGGLARDSDEPMPERVRSYVQEQWRRVHETTGATFNWDFWTECRPRRSTYPACRAVIAARNQRPGADVEMFEAIQRAYYREARNPSELDTLVALATELDPGLAVERFQRDLGSEEVDRALHEDFAIRSALGVSEFPSLVLWRDGSSTWLTRGWAEAETVLGRLGRALDPDS